MVMDGERAEEVDTPISHYEIGPTLLAKANAVSSINIGFGRTAGATLESPVDERHFRRALYAEESLDLNLFRDQLTVDETALRITLGGSEFSITENGGPFVYGIYMLVFDNDGQFLDVLYARSLADVMPQMRGKLVAYFERKTRDGEQSFTVGRLSPDPDASRHYSQFGSLEIIGISPDEFSD